MNIHKMTISTLCALSTLSVLALSVCSPPAMADAPLPPPVFTTIYSSSKQFCLTSDPATKVTKVYRVKKSGSLVMLWELPGFFRTAYLADDGEHLVIPYSGLNLLPRNYDKDQVMITFANHGRIIKTVCLKELIVDFAKLKPTASHWLWGHVVGLVNKDRFVVETVEGRKLQFEVATGKKID